MRYCGILRHSTALAPPTAQHAIRPSTALGASKNPPAITGGLFHLRAKVWPRPNERYHGRLLGLRHIDVQECDDELSQQIQNNKRVGDVLGQLAGETEGLAPSPVGFPGRLRFHAVTVFANRAFGCMSSKASITEIMIALAWSSSIMRSRCSSGNNSNNARTPAIVVGVVQMRASR